MNSVHARRVQRNRVGMNMQSQVQSDNSGNAGLNADLAPGMMTSQSPVPGANESNFSTLEKERDSQGLNSQRFSMLDGIPSSKYQAGAVA